MEGQVEDPVVDHPVVDHPVVDITAPRTSLTQTLLSQTHPAPLILRQQLAVPSNYSNISPNTVAPAGLIDTFINGLTFVFASSSRELDNLVTREFHANPNLHKNPQVELVGDYTTGGSSSVSFQWAWKFTPPKTNECRGGGWRPGPCRTRRRCRRGCSEPG